MRRGLDVTASRAACGRRRLDERRPGQRVRPLRPAAVRRRASCRLPRWRRGPPLRGWRTRPAPARRAVALPLGSTIRPFFVSEVVLGRQQHLPRSRYDAVTSAVQRRRSGSTARVIIATCAAAVLSERGALRAARAGGGGALQRHSPLALRAGTRACRRTPCPRRASGCVQVEEAQDVVIGRGVGGGARPPRSCPGGPGAGTRRPGPAPRPARPRSRTAGTRGGTAEAKRGGGEARRRDRGSRKASGTPPTTRV